MGGDGFRYPAMWAVGRAMRVVRVAAGSRVVDVAKRAGVSANTLWRFERGDGDIGLENWLIWCAALGVAPGVVVDMATAIQTEATP